MIEFGSFDVLGTMFAMFGPNLGFSTFSQLAIYTVFGVESDSAVRNNKILQGYKNGFQKSKTYSCLIRPSG